jgi:hypothetical protein
MKPIVAPSASVHTAGKQAYCSNCDLAEVEHGSTRFANSFEGLSPKLVSPAGSLDAECLRSSVALRALHY